MRRLAALTHQEESFAVARGFRAAIAEAQHFVGATAPNPPVGCAILDADGEILVVAAHHRAGAAHAEALALRTCTERGVLDRAATAIVTLEPCNHTGRTPPCTEAILASPVHTVWIGAADPNPDVAGGGAARLRSAGLTVYDPAPARALDEALALDCAALIAPFSRRVGARPARGAERPWITVKQALDASGSMVPPPGCTTFTGAASLRLAHRLRRCTEAIVTGVGTILADNPLFTVRHVADHDRRGRILAVPDRGCGVPGLYRRQAEARGFAVRTAPDLASLLGLLTEQGVLWALVEAGPRLLRLVERDALWDDWITIRQDQDGDHVAWRSRSAATPLRLIEELRGTACSPVS